MHAYKFSPTAQMSLHIDLDLDALWEYLHELHSGLSKELQSVRDRIETEAQSMSPEQPEEWYDGNGEYHFKLSEVFPKMFYHSFFVTVYSYLEHTLVEACRALAEESPKGVRLNDLKGDGIGRAQIYLKRVQGIDFPDESLAWNRIKDYQKIRNCLVHADGHVAVDKKSGEVVRANGKAIQSFAESNPKLVTVDPILHGITVSFEGCLDIIETTKAFLEELLTKIQLKLDERRRLQSPVP